MFLHHKVQTDDVWEVVAEELCLFGRCQIALDATASALHGDGTRREDDWEDGAALMEARRNK